MALKHRAHSPDERCVERDADRADSPERDADRADPTETVETLLPKPFWIENARMKNLLVVCLAIALAPVAGIGGQKPSRDSWPQWRGPSRSSASIRHQAPRTWPAELKKGWSVEVGEGYSSPIAGDGRIFVHARRDPDEVVSAIDLATGSVARQQKDMAPMEKNPYAKQMAKGPYSTPLFSEGRLGTFGTTAILSVRQPPLTGALWRRPLVIQPSKSSWR